MKPIEKAESEQFITNVHINLLAPMILTSTFMKHTKEWKVDKRVINISSGAGKILTLAGGLLYNKSWRKYVYTVRSNRRSRKNIQ